MTVDDSESISSLSSTLQRRKAASERRPSHSEDSKVDNFALHIPRTDETRVFQGQMAL